MSTPSLPARTRRLRPRAGEFPFGAPHWPARVPRSPPERSVGVDYGTAWSRRYPVRMARALFLDGVTRPALEAVASPRVAGIESLADLDPPAIFASNHASHLDTPLLLCALPARFRHRTVVGAGADYFFDRTWKAALWSFAVAAIPVERTKVDRRSALLASELLSQGWSLVIFPEGGRSPDGWAQPFKGGAAYLAKRTGLPVVPVHIKGTGQILPKSGARLRPGPTKVTFGSPIAARTEEDARHFAARIEEEVSVLADESVSDWWQSRRRAARGDTPPLSGPDISPWRRSWTLDRGARAGVDREWPLGSRR